MQFWKLFLMIVLFFGAAFAAEVESSGSGEPLVEEPVVVLQAQTLLAAQQEGSGVEASGEDVQTFFF